MVSLDPGDFVLWSRFHLNKIQARGKEDGIWIFPSGYFG